MMVGVFFVCILNLGCLVNFGCCMCYVSGLVKIINIVNICKNIYKIIICF